jgi:hypothetical protein
MEHREVPHYPLTLGTESSAWELVERDGERRWLVPGRYDVANGIREDRRVVDADAPFAGCLPDDILPPDLDQEEGRDLGWLCTGCLQPMVERVVRTLLLSSDPQVIVQATADRWRLVCPRGCNKLDTSTGSQRAVWASWARGVETGTQVFAWKKGEPKPKVSDPTDEIPEPYQKTWHRLRDEAAGLPSGV